MNGEILSVGNELLSGNVVNTNAKYLSEQLSRLGISVLHEATVADDAKELKSALSVAVSRSEVIVLTGGLGPTKDDLTKETVAAALGMELVEDPTTMARIQAHFERRGRTMPEINRKQAMIPEGAIVFKNDNGTAPGIGLTSGEQVIIMLPGPPDELVPMFENTVRPFLQERCDTAICAHTVHLFGIGESAAAEKISDLFDSENPTVAPYAKMGEVEIRVTGYAKTQGEAETLCRPVVQKIEKALGEYIYGIDVESLQHALVEQLKLRNMKIATAESCTAGLLSKKLTDVSGSSAVFDMGLVAYANSIKINALGVPASVIESKGSVSAVTAAAMAKGAWEISGADIGVSVTGNAGPDVLENKPVGLVYIGLCDGARVWVQRLNLGNGTRDKIREVAAKTVLGMALNFVAGKLDDGVILEEIYAPGVFDAVDRIAHPVKMETPVAPKNRVLPVLKDIQKQPLADIYSASVEEETPAAEAAPVEETAPKSDDVAVPLTSSAAVRAALDDLTAPADEIEDVYSDKKKAKLPWYKRMRNFLFPKRGDSVGEVIRKIIFLLAFVALIGSAVYIANYFIDSFIAQSNLNHVREQYDPHDDVITEQGIYRKFQPLLLINSDIVGWVNIPGTQIDNPVVQNTADGGTPEERNQFYIDHDLNKNWSAHGTVFLDAVADFTKDYVSQNSVLYGHHMQDGTMFNNLKHYRGVDYYKEHPVVTYDTLYRKGEYKIFAVFVTNTLPNHDDGYVFNYRVSDFESQTVFMDWITECKNRSIIKTPVDVLANDEILTLSTCVYDFDEARLVVMARRVREGEGSVVDTSGATLNPNPMYPQVWYDKRGGTKPKLTTPSTDLFHDENSIVIVEEESSKPKTSSKSSSKTSSKTSSMTSSKPTSSTAVSSGTTTSNAGGGTTSTGTTTSTPATPSVGGESVPAPTPSETPVTPSETPTPPPESEDATTPPEDTPDDGGDVGGEGGEDAGGEDAGGEEGGGEVTE